MQTEVETQDRATVQFDEPRQAAPLQPYPAPRVTVMREDPATEQRKKVGVERVIVDHSPEIDQLFAALAKAQGMFEDVERTKTARIQSRKEGGANYEFDYETLADVIRSTKKGLSENGLALMQFPFPGTSTLTLRTLLGHASGQWFSNDMVASIDSLEPKAVASGTTYLMRYARKAILGVAADDEDDDATAASARPAAPQPARRVSDTQKPEVVEKKSPGVATKSLPSPVGRIQGDIDERNGSFLVTLETGFKAATKDAEIAMALKAFKSTGATIELVTKPSSDPTKYAPVIVEAQIRRREAVRADG